MADLYHALNRGVDKRKIFLDDQDRARFVHGMYEFNDTAPASKTYRTFATRNTGEFVTPPSNRAPIVDIHGWCLMDNHYHLLLSEISENGISNFLRKLNIGYAMYFNEKYARSGTLFQGRTKKILIDSDAYFLHVLHYIHLNPLDMAIGSQDWREGAISDPRAALEHLASYRWSSYLDYCGKSNFPSVSSRQLFSDVFSDYKVAIGSYIRDMGPVAADLKPYTLE